jgi:hypothetical protein
MIAGLGKRHIASGNGGRSGTSIGLKHVAVYRDRAFAQSLHIDDSAQGAADQPLNLLTAPGLLSPRGFSLGSRVRRTRQHSIFGRHPPLPFSAQKRGYRFLHARRTQHLGVTEFDEDRALGVFSEVARELDRSQLIGSAAAWAGH